MASDSYQNDLEKSEYTLRTLKEMYISAQQIESYLLADIIKDEIDHVEEELGKLRQLR